MAPQSISIQESSAPEAQEYEFHEAANLFPLLGEKELNDLASDIKKNGLQHEIVLLDGKILDGRNRYLACLQAGIPPIFREFDGEDPFQWVWSENGERRHLKSDEQKYGIRKRCMEQSESWREMQARIREEANRKRRDAMEGNKNAKMNVAERQNSGRTDCAPSVSWEERKENQSREAKAKDAGVNRGAVERFDRIEKTRPDLAEKVIAGEITATEALKTVKKEEAARKKPKLASVAEKSPTLFVGKAESMPFISDEAVDLIITSPPYNIGKNSWPMGGNGRTPREQGIGYNRHKDDMDELAYQDWQVAVFKELYRAAKPGASFFYNHKIRHRDGIAIHPIEWILRKDNPWIFRQEIIWDRGSTHNHSSSLFWPEDERIYWLTKGKPKLPDRSIGMSTVWRFHGPVPNTWHPAPFVDELPKRCIEAVGREGITVLDPFHGSGTVAKVALSYGYDAIGVDLSEEYIDESRRVNGWTS